MQSSARLKDIRPGRNPRSHFDPQQMQELIDSVRVRGVMMPQAKHGLGQAPHLLLAA